MITQEQRRAFIMAVRTGEVMMKSGAEIYRVESTIDHICRAAGLNHVETFATPTGIFVSIGSGGEQGDVETYIKAIRHRTTDLNRISKLNDMSRDFVAGKIGVEEAMKFIAKVEKESPYTTQVRLLGAGLCVSLFSVIFGGGMMDATYGFIVGAASYYLAIILGRLQVNFFVQSFICCAAAAFITMMGYAFHLAEKPDSIIIGAIMIFAPGAAITNALRDFLRGDMLSGVSRATEAIAVAIALAAGAGFVLKIWHSIGGFFG